METSGKTNFKRSGVNEKIAAFICGVLLLIILLITSAQAMCYWIPGWWRREYAKYDTPQYVTGEMSLDDAVYITEQMLEYCIGRLDTLEDTEATIDGVTAPFFTEREKLHLQDCRNIFLSCIRFRTISILIIIVFVVAMFYSISRRKEEASESGTPPSKASVFSDMSRTLAKGYLIALAVIMVLTVIIVAIGLHDFDFLFTEFHHVFFDNDLWLLDPRRDNLVNIMQESVFADAAVTIAVIWVICAAILAGVSAWILHHSSVYSQESADL